MDTEGIKFMPRKVWQNTILIEPCVEAWLHDVTEMTEGWWMTDFLVHFKNKPTSEKLNEFKKLNIYVEN